MTFDQNDPKNLGRPMYFDMDVYREAVISMIRADEIEFAFEMIKNVPAWYRENPDSELEVIKKTLFKNLYSPMTYVNDDDEAGYTKEKTIAQVEGGYCYPRLDLLKGLIQDLNSAGHKPWVFELSTSHGPIPMGLAQAGCDFNFFAKNFNQGALAKVIEWLGPDVWSPLGPSDTQKTIFVNFESLEHAHREEDVRDDYYKLGIDFDYIFLSVPYGCLGGGLEDWNTRRLGHIRTYTREDFVRLATAFFGQAYKWQMIVSHSLVLMGEKNVEKEVPE